MKIVQINSVCGAGSTGKICVGIAEVANSVGDECKIAYGRARAATRYKEISYRIGNDFGVKAHAFMSRVAGMTGTYSKFATKKLVRWLRKQAPDIIHLHNLHGYYINYPELFRYIKQNNIRVIWTLHDCWAFTGHCAYFDMANCGKWQNGCGECPQLSEYPKSLVDSSAKEYRLKKECFTGVKNMTIVTPSKWLAGLVKKSFLSQYEVRVINNGINLEVFKPTYADVKARYGCEGKNLVLGVAYKWDVRKGLDVFVKLANKLGESYQIILVGVDKKTQKGLPDGIIGIERTENQTRLVELYTAADVFVNPTREDNFPTVNIEALACGTPVITFCTGGSPETVDKESGVVVIKDDKEKLVDAIRTVCEKGIISRENCLKRAENFNYKEKFNEYINLYRE